MSGFAVLVYKAHPRLLIFPAVKKSAPYTRDYTVHIIPNIITFTSNFLLNTVRAEIFAVVLFSRISRVKPSQKFPLQFMSIYSNDNISKIAKLTTRELPHLAKTAKITVRENNGVYSNLHTIVATPLGRQLRVLNIESPISGQIPYPDERRSRHGRIREVEL